MAQQIWKYEIPISGGWVTMQQGAIVLSAQQQNGHLCIWALVDPHTYTGQKQFQVFGTGQNLPPYLGRFIGTVQIGPFVWHVFEDDHSVAKKEWDFANEQFINLKKDSAETFKESLEIVKKLGFEKGKLEAELLTTKQSLTTLDLQLKQANVNS